ncbi:MAG: DnaJ domain-containing protein [Dehalococcoidia bacterium]|jgi:curved DNA-binding protein CbpA
MDERDHYEVLGLHPNADHEMVVKAYWHLARKYKAARDQDGAAEQALEELNWSFGVLGSPDRRLAYDRVRRQGRAGLDAADEDGIFGKRVSIEVAYWYLPAWQAMLAGTATLALAVTALLAGAPPLVVLALATVSVVAAVLALPTEKALSAIGTRWSAGDGRKTTATAFERSTAATIERWREGDKEHGATPSLLHLFRGAGETPYRPPFNRPAEKPPEHP